MLDSKNGPVKAIKMPNMKEKKVSDIAKEHHESDPTKQAAMSILNQTIQS